MLVRGHGMEGWPIVTVERKHVGARGVHHHEMGVVCV